jgi:hypothetical protein
MRLEWHDYIMLIILEQSVIPLCNQTENKKAAGGIHNTRTAMMFD